MRDHEWVRKDLEKGIAWFCPNCGLRVLFPDAMPGDGLSYFTVDAVVADSSLGTGPDRVAALTRRMEDCDEQLVRYVMAS
jgi:hypothetical protein